MTDHRQHSCSCIFGGVIMTTTQFCFGVCVVASIIVALHLILTHLA